jgi:hypothetical protein
LSRLNRYKLVEGWIALAQKIADRLSDDVIAHGCHQPDVCAKPMQR